jgi:hypothetical protein
MKKVGLLAAVRCVGGVISALLGGLWLLQGLGLVHVRPILCFANCEPLQGASAVWAIAGFVVLTAGVAVAFFVLRRRLKGVGK